MTAVPSIVLRPTEESQRPWWWFLNPSAVGTERAQSAESWAYGILLSRARIVVKCRGSRGEPQAAEELAHEALVRLLRGKPRFNPDRSSNPLAFLTGLLVRIAKELERRKRRDRERAAVLWDRMPRREEVDPAEALCRTDLEDARLSAVRSIVSALNGKDRELITRRYGCSTTSQSGGRSNTERTRLRRLLQRIRHKVEDVE